MDRKLKLSGALPDGDANGFADPDVVRAVMDNPTDLHVGIIIFSAPKDTTDHEADTVTGQISLRRVEVILDNKTGDASALLRLLNRAYERRTGGTTLDAELEEDLRSAFAGMGMEYEEEIRPTALDRGRFEPTDPTYGGTVDPDNPPEDEEPQ